MAIEELIEPLKWAQSHGVKIDIVMKLLREAKVSVRSQVTKLPAENFERIEAAVEKERHKAEVRNKNLKKAVESSKEDAPKKSEQPVKQPEDKSKRVLKGKLPLKPGRSVANGAHFDRSQRSTKPAAPKTPAAGGSSIALNKPVTATADTLVTPVKVAPKPTNNAPLPNKKSDLFKVNKEKFNKQPFIKQPQPAQKPAIPHPQMLTSDTALKEPPMKAQVFKPDEAILARIKKSQQQNQANRGHRGGGSQQGGGYTGRYGGSNNNQGNQNRRPGDNRGSNNRPYANRNNNSGFNGGSIRDAFQNSNGNAASRFVPPSAIPSKGSKQQNGRHSQNDKNRRNNKERQELQTELQQDVRQNVSRVMADLSKKPVKKVYRKEHGENAEEGKKILKTSDFITVGELAGLMEQMPARVIAKCMEMGMMVTINARLDFETIQLLADEFGFEAQLMDEYEEENLGVEEETTDNLKPRHPVVTVMGHVDHGKTSLLDWIRKTHVVAGESGGITQHIGAYEVTTAQGKVTFLDTPGHEAFSAMRARGSQVTDVIVLVVAADSMVMPQTVESIELAKREKVPMVVAITKIDLPTANPDKIRAQLAERGVEVEQWGGSTSCIEVSARTGQGMNELLETLALEAEVLELKANPHAHARGAVVESKLDVGKGSMATVLVQNGTLHVGDPFVCGIFAGRVRAMFNERGEQMKEAPPSAPCQVLGFDGTPQAGDDLIVVEDEKTAREIASKRRMAARERDLRARKTVSLENSFNEKKEGKLSELNLIVKADVGGSAEALAASLEKLSNKEVRVNIIRKAVGTITESDILLATTASAIIISFHLMPSLTVREMARKEGIEIRNYRVIYDCIEDITNAVEGLLKPTMREELCGEAEIRQVFKVPKVGLIAGCMVTDGEVDRTSHVRVYREGVELGSTVVQSLKRMKDDVKSVARGFECGIGLKGYDDIKEGDSLVFFKEVTIARTLKDVAREEAEAMAKKSAETATDNK